jgi:hypothetical protein
MTITYDCPDPKCGQTDIPPVVVQAFGEPDKEVCSGCSGNFPIGSIKRGWS